MAKTVLDKTGRKPLKILRVNELEQLPNSQVKVLRFNCDDGLLYETFKQALFPYIQTGKEIDADTELHITTTDDGRQYPHWRVVQLYEGNKPLASAHPKQQYRGRDEDRVDQRTFVMEVGNDLRAGLEVLEDFKKRRIIIMASWTAPKAFKPKDDKPETSQELPPTATATAVTVKNAGDLMRWALSHGKEFNASFVRREANIPPNEIITEEKVKEAYKLIKEKMKWED